jgi:two-component system sensor histidine kinase LytS
MDMQRTMSIVMLTICYVLFSIFAVLGVVYYDTISPAISLFAIIGMFVLTFVALRVAGISDHARARQSNQTLDLASKTVTFMREGLDAHSAQAVCDLLLPAALADAVAITNREKILGFSGLDKGNHNLNSAIQTESTRETLEDGITRIMESSKEVGFSKDSGKLRAGIVVALVVNKRIVGTIKFYYRSPRKLGENQKAIAEGFAQLLSTQLSLSYLQQQTELAARMELKALQAQINPHFLFNTINTIAAITRTDPVKARTMLREFAIYYRRLLENSEDLIPLSKEIEQTERYLMFQKARFGEDAIRLHIDMEPGLDQLQVPSFVLQPIVENAVGHGRRDDGSALYINVKVIRAADSVIISIADDGVGISPDKLENLVEGGSKTGMGIALKNVNARLKAYFGAISGLYVDSKLGEGTTVYLSLYDALLEQGVSVENEELLYGGSCDDLALSE